MPEWSTIERWILVVDDNPDDVLLIRRTFDRAGLKHPIHSVSNGDDAIAYLSGDR